MKRTQAGMTLIELVIVVIVLGIIAAVAAPKFADISGSAAIAAIDGHKGGFSSGLTIAIAKQGGLPTGQMVTNQLDGMSCTALGVCEVTSNLDLDNDTNTDVSFQLYEGGACTTSLTALTVTVTGYLLTENGVAASCVAID